jgi:hypothetical protein
VLDGGDGNDTLTGGKGNDIYINSAGTDKIVEAAGATGGTDTLKSDITASLAKFANVENLELTGSGNIDGTGNTLGNLITGNSGNNVLDGGAGNDILQGGGGIDVLKGGAGNDTYLYDSATITIDEGKSADKGDTVQSANFDLDLTVIGAGKIENAVLLGSGDRNATGNAAVNTLTGNDGSNRLDGGVGADTLIGGKGDDTYVIDNLKDVVKEKAGEGDDDLVLASVNITTVIENVENFTFTGTGNWTFKGNALDNMISGGAGNDTIDGGIGKDTVVYAGNSDDFQIVYSEGKAFLIDLNPGDGDEGVDSLVNVEQVKFSDTTISLSAQSVLKGAAAGDFAGRSVAAAGDINNDGLDDFIVGASGAKGGAGAAYVVFGDAHGLPSSLDLSALKGDNGFKLSGFAAKDSAGFAVSSAGDINKDGFDDVLIGAFRADANGADSGAAYVVFGKAGGYGANIDLGKLNGTDGFKLSGVAAGDFAGAAVGSAGDVNGDGFEDIIIGADSSDSHGLNAGSAYVVFGHSGGFGANVDLIDLDGTGGFRLTGVLSFDHAGWSVSSAGDMNGDGIDDLLVGGILAGTYGAYSGAAYVVFGRNSGFSSTIDLNSLDGTNGFVLKGVTQYDSAGWSVASAGDVNGDGFDDVIVSAPYADGVGRDSGTAYVVFGHGGPFSSSLSLGSLGSNGFVINGTESINYTGFSVSGAGDVNGDGIDDIIIGAPNAGSKFYGAAYVLFGQTSGFGGSIDLNNLDAQHGFWVYGDNPSDAAGVAVSAAGDINGDGYDDILVGASGADPHGASSGAVTVIYGSADNSGPPPIIGTSKSETLNGTEQADVIRGQGGDDTLNGLGGDDYLDGGKGADQMAGGLGNDVYNIENAGDQVVEAASGGTDTLRVTRLDIDLGKVPFLGQEIENVTLYGAGDYNLTGNALANALEGNGGNNRLSGGAGDDTMKGGDGNDTYIVDSSNDKVVEGSGYSSGTDTVESDANFTLSDNVENLILKGAAGTENLSGTGNAGKNNLLGNDGDNHLDGGAGDDTITGGKGVDTLTGGNNGDTFVFAPSDTGKSAGTRDLITDFKAGMDHLDLSAFDANTVRSGDDQFHFVGTDAFVEAGELRFTYDAGKNLTILEGDLDGDHAADFAIEFTGNIQFTSKDFTTGTLVAPRPAAVTIVNDDDVSFDWTGILPTVSNAGDLNHDGYDDFVIGLPVTANANGAKAGNAYVVYGSWSGIPTGLSLADLDGSNGFKVMGSAAGESLGFGADSAGDFNGDGVSDLLLSAPGRFGDPGDKPTHTYLLYGDPSGSQTSIDLSKLGAGEGIMFSGRSDNFFSSRGSVASLGDINADGLDDIMIGAPNEDSGGNAYVVFGGSGAIQTDLTKLNGANGFKIDNQLTNGDLGYTVSAAGDFNGDGINDLVVREGAGGNDTVAHVIFGHPGSFSPTFLTEDIDGTNGFTIKGMSIGYPSDPNQTVSSAGDVNGDGYDDLIIGGPGSPNFLVFGHGGAMDAEFDVNDLDGSNGFAITGKSDLALGRSVSAAGDLNGDGYDDILIGAPGGHSIVNTIPGYAYVIYGKASGFDAQFDVSQINSANGLVISGPAIGYQTGFSVSTAGDVDGDGLDDIIVATPEDAPGSSAGHGQFQLTYGKAGASAIMGTDHGDTLNGTSSAEIIIGEQGDDVLNGGGGADSINGGAGNDQIHVADNKFFRIDGGLGSDTLHLDYAGTIDFGNLDNNTATSDRGKIAGIEVIDVANGQANALTFHLADVLDLAVRNTNVGGVASLDNVLKIDGEAGDTLQLSTADGWSAPDTTTLAGYAIYTVNAIRVAVDTDIGISLV